MKRRRHASSCAPNKSSAHGRRHLRCRGTAGSGKRPSVLVGEHDRDHADGDGGVGRIGGLVVQAAVEVVDLEKDRVAFCLERPKVMLFVGVVRVAEVVKYGDGLDDAGGGLFAEGRLHQASSRRRRSPSSAAADR